MDQDDDLVYIGTQPRVLSGNSNHGFKITANSSSDVTTASSSARVFGSQGSNTDLLVMESKFKLSSVNADYKNKPRFSSISSQPEQTTSKPGFNHGSSSSQPLKRVTLAERTAPAPKPSGLVMGQLDDMNTGAKKEPTFPPGVLSRPPPISPSQQTNKRISYESFDKSIAEASKKRRNLGFLQSFSAVPSYDNIRKGYNGKSGSIKAFDVQSTSRNYNVGAPHRRVANGVRGLTKSTEFRPVLSDEQQKVLDRVVSQRQSIFFTGSAGTGKSVLLRAIIDRLRDKYDNGVAITASTGIAACNINGSTLHR
ncbi:hypothetical protein BX666DRAFT_1497048 [Dichotomocladium elegans]|nr:hypothetical protein BX666DRAFT_1497048 [Dichotomocladium elegans]